MTLGALTFLSPWLLVALGALPVIYWLLRTIPPRPQRVEFPPTRILKDVKDREKTPAKTPWWLLLIRLLAAALIIFALSEPVLNPTHGEGQDGDGPLAIIVDNGWSSASNWSARVGKVDKLIAAAQRRSRPVIVVATASVDTAVRASLQSPSDALITARGFLPQPFAPDLEGAVSALKASLSEAPGQSDGIDIVWLSDGVDHDGKSSKAIDELALMSSRGSLTVVTGDQANEPLALHVQVNDGGRLNAIVKRAQGMARVGRVIAYSVRDENLGAASFQFASGETEASAAFDIPLELRNQVARIAIEGERSAGAVSLLDSGSRWHRVALVSGQSAETAQPLLAPLYYLEKALKPYAQIVKSGDANLLDAIDSALAQKAGVMVMADIGTLSGEALGKVEQWVESGGILIRFAGARMEKASDDLLPVPLRIGGRTLGGALSWSTPQPLAEFESESPFAGLATSAEITVSRQVLADPARLSGATRVWARLKDGTPLVTAAKRGDGEVILFHVTANSDWSNLPISGLFVDMLRRVLARGNSAGIDVGTSLEPGEPSGQDSSASSGAASSGAALGESALLPTQTLDGFGDLGSPPPNAQAIPTDVFSKTVVSRAHPPGYYGSSSTPRALNIVSEETVLRPLPVLPTGVRVAGFGSESDLPMKPWLFGAAMALVFLDMIAVLFLQGIGSVFSKPRARASRAAIWFAVAVAGAGSLGVLTGSPSTVLAQSKGGAPALDRHAQQATNRVTLGFVLTGNTDTDRTSELGLSGLGRVLARRTSVTPGEPVGVDIVNDEIAFYPMLYWPIEPNARALPEKVLAKIDAYMKQGGLIVFDTKDFGFGQPSGFSGPGGKKTPLQRLLGQLNIPRLEPVSQGHVLTKSFYLLSDFPGRWAGGQLWVEAGFGGARGGQERKTTPTDGVTSIMITANDFASAWAMDARGRPIFPTISTQGRQREMAFRTGINIVMHALTGNYKADQVHIPSLLQRLGQ